MRDNDAKRSSVVQEPLVGFLGIDDDEWQRGVTLDRWARQRDAKAYLVASRNPLCLISRNPLFSFKKDPDLVIQYFDPADRPDDYVQRKKHMKAHERLRNLLLDDLREHRCILGVPPQSAVESALPVTLDALERMIRNINWSIGPPSSSLGNNPVRGKSVDLRLYRPDRFGRDPERREHGAAPTAAAVAQRTRERGGPKPVTIDGWKEDYETVKQLMGSFTCSATQAAKRARVPGGRSPDAIERGYRHYVDYLERQNGKNPK